MKTTTNRFERAMSALVKGYIGDTLAKGTSCGCGIGNMIASAGGITIERNGNDFRWVEQRAAWDAVFVTHGNGLQFLRPENYMLDAKRQIDATGYSWQELARIEKAFETNTKIVHAQYCAHTPAEIDADQYAGLMAAVQVLCDIEGITDAAEYKALFAKELA